MNEKLSQQASKAGAVSYNLAMSPLPNILVKTSKTEYPVAAFITGVRTSQPALLPHDQPGLRWAVKVPEAEHHAE